MLEVTGGPLIGNASKVDNGHFIAHSQIVCSALEGQNALHINGVAILQFADLRLQVNKELANHLWVEVGVFGRRRRVVRSGRHRVEFTRKLDRGGGG